MDAEIQALSNRLRSVVNNSGWMDVRKIIDDISDEATANLVDFAGWDKDQIAVLKARAQAAKELREEIYMRVSKAIQEGQEPDLRPQTRIAPMRDTRITGTY